MSGLVVNPQYPFLVASPDALIECCCRDGKGIVEIKCLFSSKDHHPSELYKFKKILF